MLTLASRYEQPTIITGSNVCARPAIVTDVGGNANWLSIIKRLYRCCANRHLLGDAFERAWDTEASSSNLGWRLADFANKCASRSGRRFCDDLLNSEHITNSIATAVHSLNACSHCAPDCRTSSLTERREHN